MTKGFIKFEPEISDLERLAPELELFGEKAALTARLMMQLHLILEELLTNTISYGCVGGEALWLEVALEKEDDMLNVTLRDNAVPFDPTNSDQADTSSALEDREIGGLGIHIVTSIVDQLTYKRDGATNELVLTFNLATQGEK